MSYLLQVIIGHEIIQNNDESYSLHNINITCIAAVLHISDESSMGL